MEPSSRVDVQKVRLVKIVFDEGEVDFNYNNIGISGLSTIIRNDLYNGDCVTQVFVKDKNSTAVKAFNFTYDYLISDANQGEFNPDHAISTYRYNRLRLLKFGEIGTPAYKFSYDETVKMPPINSFSIDFLGYFNNSPDRDISLFNNSNSVPTLFFYPNQFEKSLLPYPIPGMTPIIIPGYFNRQANDFAKTWSLNKVEYPLGGSSEYIYESNQFEESGQNIVGGGVRIAQQKLNDGAGNTRTINYSYLNSNGKTSGKLASTPFFGFPTEGTYDCVMSYPPDEQSPATITSIATNNTYSWQLYDKSNLNADITSGSYVGYSKVIESETGKGSKELSFTSYDLPGYQNVIYRMPPENLDPIYTQPFSFDMIKYMRHDDTGDYLLYYLDENANTTIANSGLYSNIFTDNSYKRGKLLEESIYNESNHLVKKTTFTYADNLLNTYTFHQCYPHIYAENGLPIEESIVFINYFLGSTAVMASNPPAFQNYLRDFTKGFIISKKDIKVGQFLNTSKTVSTYDDSGNQNDIVSNYSYNQNGYLSSCRTAVNDGDIIEKRNYYPHDLLMQNEPFVADLIANNIIGTPLQTETYRNSEKLSEEKIEYARDNSTAHLLQRKYLYAKKGNDADSALEKKMTFDFYDDKGNLLQYTMADGTPVSLVWGYKNTQLIAKIENMVYDGIPSGLIIDAQSNSDANEPALINSLKNLRNSPQLINSMVTTYTHKLLIGVSTITDPKGNICFFNYDSFGRLLNVKDSAGNLLKEHEYNYKPQY